MILNINTDSTVVFTNKLEKLKRSALPNAIRASLNSAAFDVKTTTMPETASTEFIQRTRNFFKANSKVEMAKGWDIRGMKAIVGFVNNKKKTSGDRAVEDLEQQERGGTIKSRSFVPLDSARSGGNARPVRPGNRLSGINKIVNSNNVQGKTAKQKFVNAAKKAGTGNFVIGNTGKKTLWKIESITGAKIKKKAVYSFEKGRSVNVKGTGFMKKASLESGSKIEKFYIREASKQIEKLMR